MASNSFPSIADESVDHFCVVTGASRDIGHHFMEACGGDVQSAVEMYLDSNSSTSIYARPSIHENLNDNAGEGTSFQRTSRFNNVEVRAPIPQKKERLVDEAHGYVANIRRRPRPESVFDSFRNFHDEIAIDQSSDENSIGRRKTLEQLFRPPIDLIFRGSFRAVMDYGASKNKWLIVNVQNVKEFSCQILNRDVWSNPVVKELIKKRFVFWQVYSDSYEGRWYMQFYKVTSWPQISILDPRTGEKMLECNSVDAELFCHLAEEFLSTHETPNETPFSPSPNKRIKHNDDLVDASEEKQLEAAIKASIIDKSHSNWAIISYDSDDDSLVATDDEQCKIPQRDDSRPNGPKEMSFKDYLGSSSDATTKIVLRLPNGERRMLEWPCTSKLKALFLYVQESGYKNEEFEIVTNFPRKVIDMSNSDEATLLDAKLHPQETVFVHMP